LSFLIKKQLAPKVFVQNRLPSKQLHTGDLGHSWGTPLKIGWVMFFSINKGFNKASIFGGETLHFQGLNMDMAF